MFYPYTLEPDPKLTSILKKGEPRNKYRCTMTDRNQLLKGEQQPLSIRSGILAYECVEEIINAPTHSLLFIHSEYAHHDFICAMVINGQ